MTVIRDLEPGDSSRPDIVLPDLRTFYVRYICLDADGRPATEVVTAHSVAVEECGALSFVTLRVYNNNKDAAAQVTRIFNKDQWIDVLDQAAPMAVAVVSH